ncbi:hypothetical protein [Kosakonia virus Kc261]|uniref:Uncharacterized protein n=1 Tax=Kosakonia virus Kc261 TaxID=2797326 RepID=A0AAE7P3R0_9CAUD|nr:hypothetical protein [Kosakonia virus Kc261]
MRDIASRALRGASRGLPACGIARACRVSSSAAWRAVRCPAGCAVRCCPMGTLCAGCVVLCAARGRSGICLFCRDALRGVVLCGGGGAAVVLSCLLVYCLRLPALRVMLCYLLLLSYCLHVLPSVSPTVCHPSSVRRSLVSAAPRSLCVSSDTYHYSSFHNYLMITVTYNLSDNGIYPMQ